SGGLAMGPQAGPQAGPAGDELAGRCKQGHDMLEQARCSPGRAGMVRGGLGQLGLSDFKQKCKDGGSAERGAKLESSCLLLYYEKEREQQAERRKVRAKYVSEVSALLLDPAYAPLADREGELEELTERRPQDRSLAAELSDVRSKLSSLAKKHGIDPSQ